MAKLELHVKYSHQKNQLELHFGTYSVWSKSWYGQRLTLKRTPAKRSIAHTWQLERIIRIGLCCRLQSYHPLEQSWHKQAIKI